MDEKAIYATLGEIFSEVFFRDDIEMRAGLTAQDVQGWDSFKQVEIILATEERFDIKLTSREINALHCVGDLVEVIGKKTA